MTPGRDYTIPALANQRKPGLLLQKPGYLLSKVIDWEDHSTRIELTAAARKA